MERREFLASAVAGAAAAPALAAPGETDRDALLALLRRMAEPVLGAMAEGRLQRDFAVELSPSWDGRDRRVTYLECFGRLVAGIAPWLALPDDASAEGVLRAKLRAQALACFEHSVDPASPDCLFWDPAAGQPLVDSAYYTAALLRAPKALWEPLGGATKRRIVERIKGLRAVSPPYTNWLLFAATNEAFLASIGEDYDPLRINIAVLKLNEWYVGDGWFADGKSFAFDHYNGFVIQPLLLELLEHVVRHGVRMPNTDPAALLAQQLKRCQRYCEHLERMVSPGGSWPPVGRSITYRTAVFQPLALLAWRKQLPASLPEGQVRAVLAAAHRAVFAAPGSFTRDGWMTIGFAGHQPALGDRYSNNGSMYLASASLLPLGLPAGDSYWTAPAQPWTQKRAFAGAAFAKDYRVDY
jgi:hypothetical protein